MNPIFERRSVRQFIDKKIEKETLVNIIHAGMAAPSAMNVKPWQFIVVQDQQLKERISSISPYAGFAKHSGAIIIVLADRRKISEINNKWEQDLSAATENILLQAVDEGLGGCWIGLYPNEMREKDISSIINAPSYITPFSIIALGYPKEKKSRVDHFDDSLIHWDQF